MIDTIYDFTINNWLNLEIKYREWIWETEVIVTDTIHAPVVSKDGEGYFNFYSKKCTDMEIVYNSLLEYSKNFNLK